MALVVVALLTGLGAYLLSNHPSPAPLQAVVVDGAFKPIALVGWNADVVFENATFASFSKATGFDWPEQRAADYPIYAWFEAGLKGHADGLPQGRRFTSAVNTNVLFELQPYNTNNVLLLSSLNPKGKLVLTQSAAYRSLFILTAAGGGDSEGNLQLHFSDRTDSEHVPFQVPDWWTSFRQPRAPRTPALTGLGRSNGKQRFQYEDWRKIQGDTGFALYQIEIDLTALGVHQKAIKSITFSKGSAGVTLGIFAISGDPFSSADFPTAELER